MVVSMLHSGGTLKVPPLWLCQMGKVHLLCSEQFCLKVVCIAVVGYT